MTHTNFLTIASSKQKVAGSKSLASMLPMLITTGVITLVISAVTRWLWLGFSNDFWGPCMEAWLTTWPIAFPLAYLGMPVVRRLTNYLAKSTSIQAISTKNSAGRVSQNGKIA